MTVTNEEWVRLREQYPLLCGLIDEYADWMTTLPEGATEGHMLDLIHDAIVSYVSGRNPYSFERGLEDNEEN